MTQITEEQIAEIEGRCGEALGSEEMFMLLRARLPGEHLVTLQLIMGDIRKFVLGRAALSQAALVLARPHPDDNLAVERLIDALDGECDGLAISEDQARNILTYVETGAPPRRPGGAVMSAPATNDVRAGFPGIERALLLIALDNGGVNRDRPATQVRREIGDWLTKQPADLLPEIDRWLAALNDDDLDTVCAGEEGDRAVLLSGAPPFTDDLLSRYFNEVC